MPENFKLDADALREWAEYARRNGGHVSIVDVDKLLKLLDRAVDVLDKLERLQRELKASDPEDDMAAERMASELVALLGLRRS